MSDCDRCGMGEPCKCVIDEGIAFAFEKLSRNGAVTMELVQMAGGWWSCVVKTRGSERQAQTEYGYVGKTPTEAIMAWADDERRLAVVSDE